MQGRIQDFKLGGALKKIAPSGGMREKFWGISCEKSRFYAKKIIFFLILGGAPGAPPPLNPPLLSYPMKKLWCESIIYCDFYYTANCGPLDLTIKHLFVLFVTTQNTFCFQNLFLNYLTIQMYMWRKEILSLAPRIRKWLMLQSETHN